MKNGYFIINCYAFVQFTKIFVVPSTLFICSVYFILLKAPKGVRGV